MTPAPLTPDAIEEVCSADHVRRTPWLRMTRADCAVRAGTAAVDLHGRRGDFDLWESVQYQAFHRRTMGGAA